MLHNLYVQQSNFVNGICYILFDLLYLSHSHGGHQLRHFLLGHAGHYAFQVLPRHAVHELREALWISLRAQVAFLLHPEGGVVAPGQVNLWEHV